MFRTITQVLSMAFMAILICSNASATLIGDSVTCDIVGGPGAFVCNPMGSIVGPGVEFDIDFITTPAFEINIGASSISVTQVFGSPISVGAGEVLVLGDLDWIGVMGRIVGISGFSTDVGPGITSSDVTFTDHEVRFNMSPNIWGAGTSARWDLVTRHVVPEPSTVALFCLTLAGLGFARRIKV